MIKDRLARLFSEVDADCVVILNSSRIDSNFWYFTGLKSGLFEYSALILRKRSIKLITSSLEYDTARAGFKGSVIKYSSSVDFWKQIVKNTNGLVGLNYSFLPHSLFNKFKNKVRGVRVVDVSKELDHARLVKARDEIRSVSRAAKIASRIANKIPSLFEGGMRDYELKARIEFELAMQGSTSPAFTTIIAYGPDSAKPHHTVSGRKPVRGAPVLCDFGAIINHYTSDITRTFWYDEISNNWMRLYGLVLSAQEEAITSVAPGVSAAELHNKVVRMFDSQGVRKAFTHSLGHTIGLRVHDGGSISPNSKLVLEPGMIFTIEPGLYFPGRGGIRIEDDVLVTKSGFRLLSKANKELKTI